MNYPSENKKVISYIYFSDLIGAGMGSFLISALLPSLGAEGAIVLCSITALFSSLFFIDSAKKFAISLSACFLLSGLFLFFPGFFAPDVSELKYLAKLKAEGGEVLSSKWDPVSRIDAVEQGGRIWLIENGATPVEVSTGEINASYLRRDPRYFMFEVFDSTPRNMLAIGAGGGVELAMALGAGVKNITAVEINPLVLKYMKNDFAEYSKQLYFRPEITTLVEDGRTYMHRSREKYDLIENGVVGGVGLVVPSSRVLNFMYVYVFTQEANLDCWKRLTEDGVALTIIYVLLDEYNSVDAEKGISYHMLRQYGTVKEALSSAGVDATKHMMIFQFYPDGGPKLGSYQGEYTFVFKKELTPAKVEELIGKAKKYGLRLAYAPYFSDSLELEKISAQIPSSRSVSPVRDDKPFFYHTEASVPTMLLHLFLFLIAGTFAFIILPVLLKHGLRLKCETNRLLFYFFCLGLGYILVEAVLIQKLTLFLGRPAYAFQVVLFSMLIFSGLGSYLTSMLQEKRLARNAAILVLLTSMAVFAYAFLTPAMIYGNMYREIFYKVLLSIVFIAPLALLMGTPFPTGLRITSHAAERDVIWMYGLNGAGSVLGSVAGMIIAFGYSYSSSLLAGGAIYFIAFAALVLSIKSTGKNL